ncbi:MAG: amino acid ABC transporter permease [Acetobacterales bacterium]
MATPAAAIVKAGPMAELPPPLQRLSIAAWMRENLFSGWRSTLVTLLLGGILLIVVPPAIQWALIDAVWYAADSSACRAAAGACWAVIPEKHRVMFFGLYPYEEHWRPALALLLYIAGLAISGWSRTWRMSILLPLWTALPAAVLTLMLGGVFGMPYVDTSQWGGLPLTMVIFTGTIVLGMPVAMLLALGRRARMPVIRVLSVFMIEFVRGVPLVTILFTAAVIFPLFLPPGFDTDKMVRIVVGMAIFFGCYQAEVIRGGLQAIPKGQYEAADSLGLGYWGKTRKIVLPQALRIVIPGLMNHIISAFKNSTLVIIVGLFDFLNATGAAVSDPEWINYYTEAYLFVALVYFLGAYALSRYSHHLERRLSLGRQY